MIINKEKGFTLVEIAIVLVIIGFLVGGSIPLMRVLNERKLRSENLEYLQQAKEAIISFAIINGRLPWADTNVPTDGVQNAGATNGTLPFLDLNLPPIDPYGRAIRYVVNGGLTTDRQTSCNTLLTPLAGNPSVVDAGGSATAFSVAAILISNGPMTPFGVIAGSPGGNNNTGTPNYIKSFLTATFDDEVVYLGGFELYGKFCSNSFTAASVSIKNNNTTSDAYVRRMAPAPVTDIGIVLRNGGMSICPVTPGAQIRIYTGSLPSSATFSPDPTPTPVTVSEGLVITIH